VPVVLLAVAGTACGGGGGGGGAPPPAIDVVREAYWVIGALGSAAIGLGQQFQTGGTLGQGAGMGPGVVDTTVSCPGIGLVNVYAELVAGGTFSAGDYVNAEFDECTDPGSVLDGFADLLILDWESTGGFGFTYAVTFDATLVDLQRASGGAAPVTANGQLTHTFDGLSQSGQLLVAVTTDSFEAVDSSGRRTLTNAENAGSFGSSGGVFVFTSTASGDLVSSVLDRRVYAYETLDPLVSVSDNNPTTGPGSGRLKVTDPDGRSVTLVAVDNVNVRLDIDEDGDGTVDATEDWTWDDVQ
jgi:hypothetical protein